MFAHTPKSARAAALIAVVLSALLSGCTLLIDRDSLSREYSRAGSGGTSSGGGAGAGGTSSAGTSSAGTSSECEPGADDVYCDGLDENCSPVENDTGCPAGCAGHIADGVSYMGCTLSSTFDEAETRCQAQRMHLIRIDGGGENELAMELARTLGSYVWLGGTNRSDESRFEWSDGTVFWENGPVAGVYQNFGPDQPAADATRRCVELHDSDGFWSTAPCSDSLQFICAR